MKAAQILESIMLDVEFKDRTVKDPYCPHCHAPIHEKGLYSENGVDYHRACGNAVKFPPPSKEDLDYFKRVWGDL